MPVLKKALHHLAISSVVPDEVIVIDDGSDNMVEPHIKGEEYGFPLRIIRFDPGRGAPAARNAGIRAAKGDILVMQDDDIFADYHMIRYHKQIHTQKSENAYGVMGRIYFDPDLTRTPLMHYVEEYGSFKGISKAADKSLASVGLISANFSLKRRFIENEELFDENFPFNRNEDTEFALRMMGKGLELRFHIAPSARHHSQLTIKDYFRQVRQGGYSKAYWTKNRPDDTKNCLILGAVVMRKMYEDDFNKTFREYVNAFGEAFLTNDVSLCSPVEFEEFSFFIKTATGWVQDIGIAEGWTEIIPGFHDIFENLRQAFLSSSKHERFRYLRLAYERNTNFFPMVILFSDELHKIGDHEKACTVLEPFRHNIWGKLKLSQHSYHLKKYDESLKLIQDIYAKTNHGKAVEWEQRAHATELLSKVLKKYLDEEALRQIWFYLADEDVAHNRRWMTELSSIMEKLPIGACEEASFFKKRLIILHNLELVRGKLKDLGKQAHYTANLGFKKKVYDYLMDQNSVPTRRLDFKLAKLAHKWLGKILHIIEN
jgi:glycosyltransferase involved in cell wall biosynthesis